MLLANQNIERIIKSKLGEVQISIDGASKETFEKIRVRGKFEKVIEGVTILNREANASNRNLTRMWTVLQKQNVKEIEEFVSLAIRSEFKRLTFSISLNDWGQEFWKSRNNSEVVDFDDAVQRIQKQFSFARNEGLEISLWMQKGKYSHENTSSLCPWIFNRLYISSDSKLVPCAIIGNPEVSNLGDASRTINAWNGHQYRQFREAHISGNIPQCCVSCYESDDETRDKHVYRLQRNQTFVDLSRITFKD
jgi:pyrroloquinoline quinone biosynthesis protein E